MCYLKPPEVPSRDIARGVILDSCATRHIDKEQHDYAENFRSASKIGGECGWEVHHSIIQTPLVCIDLLLPASPKLGINMKSFIVERVAQTTSRSGSRVA